MNAIKFILQKQCDRAVRTCPLFVCMRCLDHLRQYAPYVTHTRSGDAHRSRPYNYSCTRAAPPYLCTLSELCTDETLGGRMHSFKLKNRAALMGLFVCVFWTGRMLAVILPLQFLLYRQRLRDGERVRILQRQSGVQTFDLQMSPRHGPSCSTLPRRLYVSRGSLR